MSWTGSRRRVDFGTGDVPEKNFLKKLAREMVL